MSDIVSLSLFTATYDNEDAAKKDYESVKALYYDMGLIDTFDAAIVEKDENGNMKVISKHEQPTRQMGWAGAGLGLASGLLVALFPAVALSGALVLGTTATGAALGAVVGHIGAGMSRSDLKELGEVLDEGKYGLLVVALTDVGEKIKEVLKYAQKIESKEFKADQKELDKEIKEALS
ncbi:MAG: DUF1269 domain-containing protein [Campylobacterota bacterium]|nr:DUF1269 domain-containing protein [Campylobacterota bacterium]